MPDKQPVSLDLRGRRLFSADMTFQRIQQSSGPAEGIEIMEINSKEDVVQFDQDNVIPLMLIDEQKNLLIFTDEKKPQPEPGMQLIFQDMN